MKKVYYYGPYFVAYDCGKFFRGHYDVAKGRQILVEENPVTSDRWQVYVWAFPREIARTYGVKALRDLRERYRK